MRPEDCTADQRDRSEHARPGRSSACRRRPTIARRQRATGGRSTVRYAYTAVLGPDGSGESRKWWYCRARATLPSTRWRPASEGTGSRGPGSISSGPERLDTQVELGQGPAGNGERPRGRAARAEHDRHGNRRPPRGRDRAANAQRRRDADDRLPGGAARQRELRRHHRRRPLPAQPDRGRPLTASGATDPVVTVKRPRATSSNRTTIAPARRSTETRSGRTAAAVGASVMVAARTRRPEAKPCHTIPRSRRPGSACDPGAATTFVAGAGHEKGEVARAGDRQPLGDDDADRCARTVDPHGDPLDVPKPARKAGLTRRDAGDSPSRRAEAAPTSAPSATGA